MSIDSTDSFTHQHGLTFSFFFFAVSKVALVIFILNLLPFTFRPSWFCHLARTKATVKLDYGFSATATESGGGGEVEVQNQTKLDLTGS